MNKHYTYSEWLKECNTYEDTYKKYLELQKETDELWERIDKAIDYLENTRQILDITHDFAGSGFDYLLEILEGEE